MHFFSVFTLMTLVHLLIIIGVSYRVIRVRLPVAVSLAWLLVFEFSDSKAGCCTPKASWLTVKFLCSAQSISMFAASGLILR